MKHVSNARNDDHPFLFNGSDRMSNSFFLKRTYFSTLVNCGVQTKQTFDTAFYRTKRCYLLVLMRLLGVPSIICQVNHVTTVLEHTNKLISLTFMIYSS